MIKFGQYFLLLCLRFIFAFASNGFYDFSVMTYEQNEFKLNNFIGKISLVVNVASQCGYTDSHYKSLTRLHDILSYGGYFNVLAFPCNQFGEQEPAEISDIVSNAVSEYGVEFPIFDKIDVFGENANPAFRYLIDQSEIPPEWNFYKYLVDQEGQVVKVWDTKTSVEDIFDEVQAAIEKAEKIAKGDKTEPKVEHKEEAKAKDEL